MMMINTNLYFRELKRYRNFFLAWGISISVLIMMELAFYHIFMNEDLAKMMATFLENPFIKNMMTAFGTNLSVLTNALGYYAIRSAIYILLLGTFFSIMLAGKILAREEHEKTAEFLLAKPVTRLEVVWSKLGAFLTYLFLLSVMILFSGSISLEIFKGESVYRLSAFFVHSFYFFLLMLTFGAIGLFLSLLIKRGRPITNISIGLVFGGYLIDVLSKATQSASKFGYISPFKFMDSEVLRPDYCLEWWRVLYFLGISFVLIALTFIVYRKKDILV
jgi:ABC-2 type transport system permease protein